MAKRNYSNFINWIEELDRKSSTPISIDQLAKDCGMDEGFPKNCNWSNNRSNAFANRWLQYDFIVKHDKVNKTVQFIYDYATARAILNGEGTIILNNMYTGRYISSQGNLQRLWRKLCKIRHVKVICKLQGAMKI